MASNNNADISSQTIATTYDQVLHIGDTGNLTGCGAGNEKYIVDGSGTASTLSIGTARVGIGTASPDVALHIQGTEISGVTTSTDTILSVEHDASCGISILSASDNHGYLVFGDDDDNDIGWIQYNHATNAMTFRANAANRMTILSSGNVGIGTADPNKVGYSSITKVLTVADYGSAGDHGVIEIGGYRTNDGIIGELAFPLLDSSGDYSSSTAASFIRGIRDGATTAAGLQFLTEATGASATAKMTILGSGNVGIGETSPGATLHIKKAATTGSSPLELLRLEVEDGGVELAAGMGASIDFYMPHDSASFKGAYISAQKESAADDHESIGLHFGTCANTGTVQTNMLIDEDGNVGIGHTNPAHDLCVGDNVSGHHTALRLSTNTDGITSVIFAIAGTTDKWNISNSAADQLYIYDYGDSSIAMHCDTTEEAWGTGSDSRIKENVANIGSILTKLNDLNPITYQRKYSKSDKFYAGLVAQEVLPNFPLVVTGAEDTFKEIPAKDAVLDDDGNVIEEAASLTYEGGLSLKYSSFVQYLIKAIQELSAKVTALENA